MANTLVERRADSTKRLKAFRKELSGTAEICNGKACVYVTGSFGRGEAGRHSDLDLFIVGRTEPELRNLDAIRVKAGLIDATVSQNFPPFSGDGEYLIHYTIDQLVKTTGKPDDDANNTFTARLLLLLESRPLIGEDVYKDAIGAVIEKYWGDYERHKTDFVPGFLANDILRLWRTFCVSTKPGRPTFLKKGRTSAGSRTTN